MNEAYRPPSRAMRVARFAGGIAWLAFVALFAAMYTRTAFAPVFAVVLGGALACGVLALAWLTLWAQRRNSIAGQFTIGSLLFATSFAAIFFAAVRWLGTNWAFGPRPASPSGASYFGIAVGCLIVLAISIPIVFGMLESLLRLAIWLMHLPVARPALRFVLRGVGRIAGAETSRRPRSR